MSYFQNVTAGFDGSVTSAFGTLETGELTPLVQLDFIYGLNSQLGASTVSGTGATVDANQSRLRIQCGTGAAGSALYTSRAPVRYRAGQGITARFTAAFNAIGLANNTTIVGCGSLTDGYFFGYNGVTFGILHRNNTSDTWIAKTAWNGDKLDGTGASGVTLSPTFGNVYQIKYPYLGYGTIKFYVENPSTGGWILVHTIAYPNTTQTVQLGNPSLSFYAHSLNTGNVTNATTYVGSVGIQLSGKRNFVASPKWAIDNNKSGVTTELNILTLKNATNYNNIVNRGTIRINTVAVASTGNNITVVRGKLNPTVGGAPAFTPISGATGDNGTSITGGQSIASYDVAGTTIAGGVYVFNVSCGANGSSLIDLSPFDFFMNPGDTLALSAFATASAVVSVGVDWSEDV